MGAIQGEPAVAQARFYRALGILQRERGRHRREGRVHELLYACFARHIDEAQASVVVSALRGILARRVGEGHGRCGADDCVHAGASGFERAPIAQIALDDGCAQTREVLDFCRAERLDYVLGVAPTTTLRKHVVGLEASTKARYEASPKDGKARRYKEFYDGAASWSRVERIIARIEAGADGPDTRFVVTNLKQPNAGRLYENDYCRRGRAENHIKSWKTHLAADRTSCTRATANQLRLFLHAGAYWLMWGLRQSMPKRSMWRVAQFDTLRLRVIKIAARVVEMKTMIRLHLPSSCPVQRILNYALGRIPRLAT